MLGWFVKELYKQRICADIWAELSALGQFQSNRKRTPSSRGCRTDISSISEGRRAICCTSQVSKTIKISSA